MRKCLFIGFLAVSTLLNADTLVLRNGSTVEGSFLGGDGRSIRFAVGEQISTYYVNDVESIRFSTGMQSTSSSAPYPQNPGAPPQNANYPAPANYPPPANYPAPAPAPPPAERASAPPQNRPPDNYSAPPPTPGGNGPMGVQVPAGTQIVVRLIDGVNSERDRLGQTYRASVDQPIAINGQTVIPRGSDAIATLIDSKESGKIEGRTVLTLDLKTITISGHSYDLVTTGVPETSGSRGARSAKVIGGAAALGAIIGAAAGGGKGAAIGAGSGAGIGTAAEVMTSGQKVKVPAETRLTFTLQNPIDF